MSKQKHLNHKHKPKKTKKKNNILFDFSPWFMGLSNGLSSDKKYDSARARKMTYRTLDLYVSILICLCLQGFW